MSTWDKALMHPPASLESEISWVQEELARARQEWAEAVLLGHSDEADGFDREIEDLVEQLEQLRTRIPWPPLKRRAG